MNRKLTLSVDDSIIEKAKKYAEEHKESLSHLVENYFRLITGEIEVKESTPTYAPEVQELLGSISAPKEIDIEEVKYSYLKEKLLND